MSLYGAANLITNAIAPAIGEAILPHGGWTATWIFAACASVAALIVAITLPRMERAPVAERTSGPGALSMPLLRVFAASFLAAFAFMSVFAFHQPYAIEEGVTEVRGFFIGWALLAVLVRLGMGGISDRLGTGRVAFVTQCAYTLPPLALVLLGPSQLFFVGCIHGLIHGLYFPVMSALAVERVDPRERGRALTFQVAAFNGGTTAAGASLGLVAEAQGYPTAFIVASVVAAMGVFALGAGAMRRRALA